MKLYFENAVTTVTTLMILALLGYIGWSVANRAAIQHWGCRSLFLLVFGLAVCCCAAARDGLDKTIQQAIDGSCAPGLFQLVSVPTIVGCIGALVIVIAAIATPIAKTQRAREVWFCVMSGGAVLKIATVEIARIIHGGGSTMPQMNKGGKFIFGQSIIQGQKTRRLRAGVYLFAIMEWVSAIGYRMFPLSDSGYAGAFQDVMHMVVTALVVLLSIVSLSVIVSAGLKDKSCRFYGVCAAIALGMMIIGAMGMKIVPAQYFGVVERFSVFAATGFNAALGIHLFCIKDEGVK